MHPGRRPACSFVSVFHGKKQSLPNQLRGRSEPTCLPLDKFIRRLIETRRAPGREITHTRRRARNGDRPGANVHGVRKGASKYGKSTKILQLKQNQILQNESLKFFAETKQELRLKSEWDGGYCRPRYFCTMKCIFS